MGSFTLETFRSELLFDLKNRSDTGATDGFTTTRQDAFINAAYLHITRPDIYRHRELQFNYTLTLVSGQQAYTFTPAAATNITAIRSISHVAAATDDPTARRTKLTPRDIQWLQSRTSNNATQPREYVVRRNEILLSPIPGANEAGQVLSLETWQEPAVLVAGQATVLSTLWDEVILLAARWRAELHLGYRDLAEATKVDWISLLNEYKSFEDLHGEDWDWQVEVRTESAMETA
jgi:hypothetical protein